MTSSLPTRHQRPARERWLLTVTGVVQGVGFRPFVARLADELGLAGLVGNDATSVFVEAEGPVRALDELVRRLSSDAPPLARIVAVHTVVASARGDSGFRIVQSQLHPGARTLVPPDVATCDDCIAELHDPTDRRHRHPFITCTNCGPRLTIIEDLPYDRAATTMRGFPPCPACAKEYADPHDRRYHAQPVACHDCGPVLWLEEADGTRHGEGAEALTAAVDALRAGQIVAVKGIGGFHLACDATDSDAVAELRARKRRPSKPFAVMVRDLFVAADLVRLDAVGAETLRQPARPIVLLPLAAREDASLLSPHVAPDLDELGVLLPYTPVHHLLLSEVPHLVMTSGNLTDEPLCFDNDDARSRLAGIADLFLTNDRPISVPCEDSVVTILDGVEQPIRRSRGFAPLPVALAEAGPSVLAVGAELKNTFTLTRGDLAFCSAHLGDMGSLESQHALERSVDHLTALHGVTPAAVVADEHPAYLTTSWAERRAQEWDVPFLQVQHHHAHLASLLAEHRQLGTPALGVTYDGTGYSCDRTVWGGELLFSGGDITAVTRVGHLQQFDLPGGDKAVREPWRVALSLLQLAGIEDPWGLRLATDVPMAARALVVSQLASGVGVASTSSAGRLFDAVAALLGVRLQTQHEAQAAMQLEAVARRATRAVVLRMQVADGEIAIDGLVRDLVNALRDGADVDALALGFHHALADATALLVVRRAAELGVHVVGLTGGVMQNRLLAERLGGTLRRAGLRVLTHRVVPPNDGGLSLGQAVVGRARLVATLSGRERGDSSCV